jgi:hypothetical protein
LVLLWVPNLPALGVEHDDTTVMADPHIEFDAAALSPSDAQGALSDLLRRYGVQLTPELRNGTHKLTLTPARGDKVSLAVPELLTQLHLTGACELDRARWVDTDPHGSIATEVPEGLPIVIATGPRNSPPLLGPGYVTNDVVSELLDDVLVYRRAVAQCSRPGNDMYRPAFRAYRAYLAASISSIDATLNRLAWFALNTPAAPTTPTTQKLLSRKSVPLDEKLRNWLPVLTSGGALSQASIQWHHYQELKRVRNSMVHVNDPEFLFAPRDAVDVLNLCRHGVGGLLQQISGLLKRHPSPAVLRVARAPLARFATHL